MRILLFITGWLYFLSGCTEQSSVGKKGEDLFIVSYHKLTVDTSIQGVQFFDPYFLLKLDNGRFAVLDTNLNRHTEFEKPLKNTGTNYFYSRNDSVILETDRKEFYLAENFQLKPLVPKFKYPPPIFYGEVFLEDSTYQIYGCCAGEFGGSLFFYNKKTRRLFFHNSGCVDQVIWHRNAYVVFDNLYNAGYTRISDPERLIELQYKDRMFGCNWWTEVDSLNNYEKNRNAKIEGVVKYAANGKEYDRSLVSFIQNDTLFTIGSSDSTTYLYMHQGDSLKPLQILLDKKLWFHHAEITKKAGRILVSFTGSMKEWNSETKQAVDESNSGFVQIQGRRIIIAENPTKRSYIMQ
jgi:hypothetical protein